MMFSTVCVPYIMVFVVAGAALVGGLVGCGSGRDELIISGGEGGNVTDAQPDTSSSGQGGVAGQGGGGGTGGDAGQGGGAGSGGGEKGGSAGEGGGAGTGGSGGAAGSGGVAGSGGGGVIEGPSCKGLANTCGDKGDKSCCSSLLVPKGDFLMGRGDVTDACPGAMSCSNDELPEHKAEVSEFLLDEFEVTVGRFRRFVAAYAKPNEGAGAHPKILGSGWKAEWDRFLPDTADELKTNLNCSNSQLQTWREQVESTEQLPINCVNWYVAFAFCAWDGGRLPTEAEWEYAAAGGDQNRLYPWGPEMPDKSRAAFNCLHSDDIVGRCKFEDIAKVGMLPGRAGRWCHKDLAGNMWEWVLDGYSATWYSAAGGGNVCIDCACITENSERVMRGGAFNSDKSGLLRAAFRRNLSPVEREDASGFRCARTPQNTPPECRT